MSVLYLHSKFGCGACQEAKDYLDKLEIPYVELNVELDGDALHRLHRDKHNYVPQFYISDSTYVSGGLRTLRTMRKDEILSLLT